MQNNILVPIAIYLATPFVGLISYIWLYRKMVVAKLPLPPKMSYFFLFVNYGGLLVVLLTSLFWFWSGMASLGVFYLMLIAPISMMVIGYIEFKRRTLSQYHKWAFILSLSYIVLIAVPLVIFIANSLR
jgi:hypothetical protein